MRRFVHLILAACFCGLIPAAALADAEILLRDGSKVKGQISAESTQGIGLVGKKDIIPAREIADVVHEVNPISVRLGAYRPATAAERDYFDPAKEANRMKYLNEALAKYKDSLEKLDSGQPFAQRHLEYKIADLMSRQVREGAPKPEFAVLQLRDFKDKHGNSWQIVGALKNLAEMYLDLKNFAQAEETYQELATANVDALVKQEAELLAAQVSARAGKHDIAQKRLQALVAKLPKDSPVAGRAQIAVAETLFATKKTDQARQMLQTIIKGSEDGTLKAHAYNALGKSYFDAEQLNEARWEFLWVDVMYNQDPEQHAKALYHLWQIFSSLGEQERALDCRNLLLNNRAFLGTEYQRLAKEN